TKVGCFIGDHTKTALGTLLNTGTSVGCFCNLVPAGALMPKYLPHLSAWWDGGLREAAGMGRVVRTADEVMKRGGAAFTEAHEAVVRHLFAETATERRRALRDAELRRLRRSA